MNIGSKLQFEVPDQCPEDCMFKGEFQKYGQSAICGHCPVFTCREDPEDKNKEHSPLVPANNYRNDWAKHWENFFKTGEIPQLHIEGERE